MAETSALKFLQSHCGKFSETFACLVVFQSSLDEATDNWGIKVERVEIKDVKLPQQMQRAMAAEAEAAREARAKVGITGNVYRRTKKNVHRQGEG